LLAIIVPIATLIGTVAGILPGVILALLFKIPLLGRVIHTAVFAIAVTILLVSICLTVGTALGHYEDITFGFMKDLDVIGKTGDLGKGATIGQFVNALLATYSPTVIFPCLALGVLAAIIIYWRKLYHWVETDVVIDFIIITAVSLGICVIGGIITMIIGKFSPIWVKGLFNTIFIVLAFIFWLLETKEGKPLTKEELEQKIRAAEAGNPDAQRDLAWVYKDGKGVKKDMEIAKMWYRKAADQGHKVAIAEKANFR
jgi:hypothetical protein